MNKKIAMIFTLLAVTSMTLTACGGNDNTQASDTSADTTVTTPVESTPDETEDSEASWIVSEADTNVSLPEGEAVKPDDGQPAEDDSAFGVDPDANAETTVPETFENTTNSLKPIIEKITSESEWPALDMVTDPTILSEYFLLDASNENYKEMIVMQCPISAVMSEIIIIQADDVDAAAEDLKARQQKAIDQDAWYPDDIDMANNSIVGTCGIPVKAAIFKLVRNVIKAGIIFGNDTAYLCRRIGRQVKVPARLGYFAEFVLHILHIAAVSQRESKAAVAVSAAAV